MAYFYEHFVGAEKYNALCKQANDIDHPLLANLTPDKRVELLMALGEELLKAESFTLVTEYYGEYVMDLMYQKDAIAAAMKRCGLEE